MYDIYDKMSEKERILFWLHEIYIYGEFKSVDITILIDFWMLKYFHNDI